MAMNEDKLQHSICIAQSWFVCQYPTFVKDREITHQVTFMCKFTCRSSCKVTTTVFQYQIQLKFVLFSHCYMRAGEWQYFNRHSTVMQKCIKRFPFLSFVRSKLSVKQETRCYFYLRVMSSAYFHLQNMLCFLSFKMASYIYICRLRANKISHMSLTP